MRLTTIFLLLGSPVIAKAQKSEAITQYIYQYQQLAAEEQLRTGIPAAITLAQGIHESGAGLGDLAQRSNNHFGIKCKSNWQGDKVFHDDDEAQECFRSYPSVYDSYKDHSDFLRAGQRYASLFNLEVTDYSGWAKGLRAAGYATNPKYPQILTRIIEENNLDALSVAVAEGKYSDLAASDLVWVQVADKKQVANTRLETNRTEQTIEKDGKNSPVLASKAVETIKVNHCKAVVVASGSSLKKLASQHGLSTKQIMAYNDLKAGKDILEGQQTIFLEEKKKKGANKTHEVQRNETVWSISQQEGIQLASLLAFNNLSASSKLKAGQVLYLRKKAPK